MLDDRKIFCVFAYSVHCVAWWWTLTLRWCRTFLRLTSLKSRPKRWAFSWCVWRTVDSVPTKCHFSARLTFRDMHTRYRALYVFYFSTLHSAYFYQTVFLSTSHEIGWEKCPQNGLFFIQWDVKHELNQATRLSVYQTPLDHHNCLCHVIQVVKWLLKFSLLMLEICLIQLYTIIKCHCMIWWVLLHLPSLVRRRVSP